MTKRTRPVCGARIQTLDSVTVSAYHHNTSVNSSSISNSTSSNNSNHTESSKSDTRGAFKTQHICTLPGGDHAESLLRRIYSEFQTIAKKRGYNLTTVTEMCCCGDGLDDVPTSNGHKRGGRKARRMPDNVLGYNLGYRSRKGGSHRIHLRLRHPRTHEFYPYEDIAGTMCHELAHCEIGPHNAKFYKLMDEIMEQHAVFMAKGIVADASGFPLGSDKAFVLGSTGGGGHSSNSKGHRIDREHAAQRRLDQQRHVSGTFVLGGRVLQTNGANAGRGQSSSLAHLPPTEAARRAAERRIEERRINDSKYCLPCSEIIEILDEHTSDNEEKKEECSSSCTVGNSKVHIRDTRKEKIGGDEIILIDSDDDVNDHDDDDDIQIIRVDKPSNYVSQEQHAARNTSPTTKKITKSESIPKKPKTSTAVINESNDKNEDDEGGIGCSSWSCSKCTIHNNPLVLICQMCGHERNQLQSLHERKQKKLRRHLQKVKENEVERSREQFGGFNIYGNSKASSRTLHHLI